MNNNEMIAFCGLVCTTCPIHLATIETDEQKKMEIKRNIIYILQQQYGQKRNIEEITDCDGCLTEGSRIYISCASCTIRECARHKALINCAYCKDYPCEKLNMVFAMEESARTRLNQIKKDINSNERSL